MPSIKFTKAALDRLKPPATGQVDYFDQLLPGFGLRIGFTGHRVWMARFRLRGKKCRKNLAPYALCPDLGEARALARNLLGKVHDANTTSDAARWKRLCAEILGAGASTAKAAPQVAATAARINTKVETFGDAADLYLAFVEARRSANTYRNYKQLFDLDLLPRWRNHTLASLTVEAGFPREVGRMMDELIARGAPQQSRKALQRLKTFLNWASEPDRGFVTVSDAAVVGRIKARVSAGARDRVLSHDEIRWLWAALPALGWPFAPIVKLLCLTLQRKGEVAGMLWPELDLPGATWHLAARRTKNARPHIVHLSDFALEVFADLPRVKPEPEAPDYVFSTTGLSSVSGWSRAKGNLDRAMEAARRREFGLPDDAPDAIPAWTFHDLRRTGSTVLCDDLGVAEHVADLILNHQKAATPSDVKRVYNRAAYADARCAALQAYGEHIRKLTAPTTASPHGKVVKLAARRR